MKAALLTIVLFCLCLAGFSQRQYFVLVESEKAQSFYVRIGEAIHNSSSVGHVILSELIDSTFILEIGFPKEQYPSNQFQLKMNKKDHGFQLKNLPGKGWVLFDYQTTDLIYPIKREVASQSGYSMVKKDDGFARLLAQVVNDTAVLYSIVYEKPPEAIKKEDTKVVEAKVIKENESRNQPDLLKEPVELPKETHVVAVTKIKEMESDSGKHITYVDNKDSIKIFIVAEAAEQKPVIPDGGKEGQTGQVKSNTTKVQEGAAASTVKSDTGKSETGSHTVETVSTPLKGDSLQKVSQKSTVDTAAQQRKLVLVNSDCKAVAWDNDVDKLRVKMLGEKDVDNKINVARKIFKTKCFNSTQIKALTELFVTDQDKYKFLDAAYPFVVDTENFKQLSYLLNDEYYVKRFRTMVRLD